MTITTYFYQNLFLKFELLGVLQINKGFFFFKCLVLQERVGNHVGWKSRVIDSTSLTNMSQGLNLSLENVIKFLLTILPRMWIYNMFQKKDIKISQINWLFFYQQKHTNFIKFNNKMTMTIKNTNISQ